MRILTDDHKPSYMKQLVCHVLSYSNWKHNSQSRCWANDCWWVFNHWSRPVDL